MKIPQTGGSKKFDIYVFRENVLYSCFDEFSFN